MQQLIIISLQIIYYCLAWLLLTFSITPFSSAWNLVSGNSSNPILPDWAIHTHYLFAIMYLSTGIAITLRLKVMKQMNSTALFFSAVLLAFMAFYPKLLMINLLKYSYIIVIPVIFQKIILLNGENIHKWIKSCIQISLIYSSYHVAMYLFQIPILNEITAIVLASIFTLIAIGASLVLYTKKYYTQSLNIALLIFIVGSFIDILEISMNFKTIEFNQLPLMIISWSMIIFTIWVHKMLHTQE